MNILINTKQLNFLLEQDTGYTMRLDRIYSNPETASKFNREMIDFYTQYKHQINMVASIGLSLIPIIGPILGTSISLLDAKQYYDEGDKKTAGLVGMFSMIPFLGPVVSKIPLLRSMSSKSLSNIAAKLSKGQKLNSAEQNIVLQVSENQNLIRSEITKLTAKKTIPQKIASTASKTGKVTAKAGASVGKSVAPYAAAGYGYSKTYDYVQRNTPKTKSEKEGLNWEFVRQSFGSSGSKEDNILLNNAWKKGWRPGQVVPGEFQTNTYKENFSQEDENINKLEQLIAQNS